MIHSMTAFARRETDTPWGTLTWELRSVNHRYLDFGARLPEELRGLEPKVRSLAQARLKRGKVDGTLWFTRLASADMAFDAEQVRRLMAAAGEAQRLAGSGLAPLRAIDVLRWPGVVQGATLDVEGIGASALTLLARTLDELVEARSREGAQLRDLLLQRLATMERIVTDTRTLLPEAIRLYRERLELRLKEIREQLEPARLEQEMVLFANRIDVAEELDRLAAHVSEIRRVLDAPEPAGRRLDFLMQELNREANTLGSKAADVRVTNASVELKVLIDQMREQIQNIE
ncbi:MAG: YicC family protein [Candidatus Muproteobacteria bacterium RBG_16_64_10]|uniref:YicC family protein n=1 Tax=Candidatus Muproteobacteria bacterium RBG_16_64_10 TaxID=1817757 RepID=A0A1F6SWN5_9PROT|nr:MAG: YicC family protein [Candidatus Muproteobacteria bacterium RBG_16_64_10]